MLLELLVAFRSDHESPEHSGGLASTTSPPHNVGGCLGNDEFDMKTFSVALADGRIVTAVANYI